MATPSNVLIFGFTLAILLNIGCAETTTRTRHKVTTILENPFTMVVQNPGGSNGTLYEGFLIDVLQELSQRLNFDYDLDLVVDGRYGSVTEEGNWTGMIGHLVRGEADIAAAPISVASRRAKAVDFSQQYMRSGPVILMKRPKGTSVLSSVSLLLEPLSAGVWILAIVAYIAVSLMLYGIWRWSPFEWGAITLGMSSPLKESFNLKNSFFYSLSTMFWQGYRVAPRSLSGRIITGVWWTFTTFLLLSYTASLTGRILVRYTKTSENIRSFDDLAKSDMSYGTILNGRTMNIFKTSVDPTRQMMWQKMNQDKTVFAKSTAEGINRVRQNSGNYAFIMELPMAEYTANSGSCDLMVTGEPLTDDGYGFACKKGSGVCAQLSHALLALKESTRLHDLRRKWFTGECNPRNNVLPTASFFSGGQGKLTLVDFAWAFGFVLIGIIVAVAALVLEIVLNRKGVVVATTYKEDEMRIQDSGEGM